MKTLSALILGVVLFLSVLHLSATRIEEPCSCRFKQRINYAPTIVNRPCEWELVKEGAKEFWTVSIDGRNYTNVEWFENVAE